MGTGSVTGWFSREFSVCRRCLSPFSDGEYRAPWKKGTGTSRLRFSPHFRPISAPSFQPPSASPHFPLTAYSLRFNTERHVPFDSSRSEIENLPG